MRKMKTATVDEYLHHLFVHGNEAHNFALFSGMAFPSFISYYSDAQVLLLLEHGYDDASFDMHTQFEYIDHGEIRNFTRSLEDQKSRLCLLDIAEEKRLLQLSPQEQAELLYVAHKKETFRSPFYHVLKNRFVFLSDEQDRVSKVYFREYDDMMNLIVHVFNQLAVQRSRNALFFRRRVQPVVPELPLEELQKFEDLLEDGALASLAKMDDGTYRLELREVQDPSFPDEIMEDIESYLAQPTLGVIAFMARPKLEESQ